MNHAVVLVFALVGLGLALAAALLDGTGVTGTAGAWLAVAGAAAALLCLALLALLPMQRGLYRLVAALAVLAAGLTAVAAWFLMQNILAGVMVIVGLAPLFIATRPGPGRRIDAP